jgi:hypothetical protein
MSWSFSQECECELGDKDGLECVVNVAGTRGSNPLSSRGESGANLIFGRECHRWPFGDFANANPAPL